ncbi:hypothetical protein HS088_TW01G00202 [Tripterygium wilfordii]|uniref:Uncharacterized protein n=1 Tax=Tripterygium wilfordii TaxID=458696 RepID=A0A7J7E1H0_TRIWF|nr:hypothetical protein HS088_TW01G00202 [Tripterygium wilfordii]
MDRATKLNWIRSGLVVIGSLAFGYLTLEIGFKPFLLRAQQQQQQQQEVLQNQEETLNRDS